MDQVTLAKNQVRADNWRSLIQECQKSGQTVIQWCQTNNINTKTYYYWLRKLRTQAILESSEGTSQQTIQAVLFALQSVC